MALFGGEELKQKIGNSLSKLKYNGSELMIEHPVYHDSRVVCAMCYST